MPKKRLSIEEQLEIMIDRAEQRILEKVARAPSHRAISLSPSRPMAEPKRKGRPRSRYQTQLHIRVLEEDREWFMNTAQAYEVQSGKLFSHLRSLHQQYENEHEGCTDAK